MEVERALTSLPVVRDLPTAVIERLAAVAQVVSMPADEVIWERGDATNDFMFLISGQVRLTAPQTDHGNLLIDVVDNPGAMVCVPAVSCAAPYCCKAVCGRHSEMVVIPRDQLLAEVQSPVAMVLLQQATQRGMSLCRRLREVGGSKVETRVASVLLRLADERGIPHDDGVRLPPTLSRKDLAGMTGCATETLIRELARLEKLGAISRIGRSLLIHSQVLADLIYGAEEARNEAAAAAS